MSAAGLLDGIHCVVSSFEETVSRIGVGRVECDSDAGRSAHHVPAYCEGTVEAVLEAVRDLVYVRAIVHRSHDDRELIAAQTRQSVTRPQLTLHAQGCFLQVHVAHLVAVLVIDLLELIEVDEDEAEDACGATDLRNHGIQMLLEREAVGNVGEQIELRAMHKI